MGYNKIILQGNITKDIELRYLPNGTAVAKSAIACNKTYISNGEKKEEVLFVNFQLFGKMAEVINQYCHKGSKILIDGELKNNNWIDNHGNNRYDFVVNVSNIVMLDSKSNNTQANQSHHQGHQQQKPPAQSSNSEAMPEIDIDDEEIPF